MLTILITGFGPFPGAPFNPSGPLALELARRRHPASSNVRRIAHVFRVSYQAVDHELPELLVRERPDALVMFGLAGRSKHLRVETRARNSFARMVPDVGGHVPVHADHRSRSTAGALAARSGAAAPDSGKGDRCAGRALARRGALSLQLSVLARRQFGSAAARHAWWHSFTFPACRGRSDSNRAGPSSRSMISYGPEKRSCEQRWWQLVNRSNCAEQSARATFIAFI